MAYLRRRKSEYVHWHVSILDSKKIVFGSIQFSDQELARLQAQAAAYQTARMAYAKALQAALPTAPIGDTLKFS
jgi:hypothetical protein